MGTNNVNNHATYFTPLYSNTMLFHAIVYWNMDYAIIRLYIIVLLTVYDIFHNQINTHYQWNYRRIDCALWSTVFKQLISSSVHEQRPVWDVCAVRLKSIHSVATASLPVLSAVKSRRSALRMSDGCRTEVNPSCFMADRAGPLPGNMA